MTPTEAGSLAETLTRAWPHRGVAAEVWTAVLEPLEYGAALDAIAALVDTFDQPPSVAAYRAAYRAAAAPTQIRYREDCAICGGCGYEIIDVRRPNHQPSTGAVPCRCSNGRQYVDAHQRACDHNDRELHRIRPLNATQEHAA